MGLESAYDRGMLARIDRCLMANEAALSLFIGALVLGLLSACGHSDAGEATSTSRASGSTNSTGAVTAGVATSNSEGSGLGGSSSGSTSDPTAGESTSSGGSSTAASGSIDGGTGARGSGTTGTTSLGGAAGGGGADTGDTPGVIQYVFVIPLENHDESQIVGNTQDAPYLNDTLLANYASGSNFTDQLPLSIPSEPHYVWMEAGTNEFMDHTFTNDNPPSASNSTADPDHLVTQLRNANNGLSWRSYQEGLNDATGACPLSASGFYAPKHDPFIFFQDVAGNPPSKTNEYCASQHEPLSALASDLESGDVASYNFVVPNQCHDMHGQSGCPEANAVRAGDSWLEAHLPDLIDFVTEHSGVIFIVWDEGEETSTMPFVAVGPGVKSGHVSSVEFTHSSLLKSVEEILGLAVLDRVVDANDFSDLFEPGEFP